MNVKLMSVALVIALQSGLVQGADEKKEAERDVFAQHGVVSKGTPISNLPEGIPSVEGKVTLHADFARAKTGEPIDVYLINRSERDLVLNAQDGDVYLKLQAQGEDGWWKRVQPHSFSPCMVSYALGKEVPKGCFLRIKGHQPKEGMAAKIRFLLYMQEELIKKGLRLVTQEGDGIVSADEAEKAAYDALALRTGSFEMVRELATGKKTVKATAEYNQSMQWRAVRMLTSERFEPEQVLPVLDEIEKEFPGMKDEVLNVRLTLKGRLGQ
jgi:hypothetical protein